MQTYYYTPRGKNYHCKIDCRKCEFLQTTDLSELPSSTTECKKCFKESNATYLSRTALNRRKRLEREVREAEAGLVRPGKTKMSEEQAKINKKASNIKFYSNIENVEKKNAQQREFYREKMDTDINFVEKKRTSSRKYDNSARGKQTRQNYRNNHKREISAYGKRYRSVPENKEREKKRKSFYEKLSRVKNVRKMWKLRNRSKINSSARLRYSRNKPFMQLRNKLNLRNYRKTDKYKNWRSDYVLSVKYRHHVLRFNANYRRLLLTVDPSDIYKLCARTVPCTYCGEYAAIDKPVHSLDRIDNDVPYLVNNVVTCCKDCNMMKWKRPVSGFIRMACNIANKQTGSPVLENIKYDDCEGGGSYYDYSYSARKKGFEFALEEEDFDVLVAEDCAYCGRNSEYSHGVDRIDSAEGYNITNVLPSCGWCNYAKKNLDMVYFLNKCSTIAARWHHLYNLSNEECATILKQSCNQK